MFTVKHVNYDDHTEQLAAGEYFLRERRKDGFTQFTIGKSRDDYSMTWCGDERNCEYAVTNILYVMNEQGSTVARYNFHTPTFDKVAD